MEERGTFFFFFFSRGLKTHHKINFERYKNENTYSLLRSLSANFKRVVIKRDVFTFFFVFFSRWG